MNILQKKYSREWFKIRAMGSLEKKSARVWDYSDSLLLYSPKGQQTYTTAQERRSPYFELVTKHSHDHLKSNIKYIVSTLPNYFEYIDLGPGNENKQSYFFEELRKNNKACLYIPVDISIEFLKIATSHAKQYNIETHPVQASFEELPYILTEQSSPRFVSIIGLTFSNYQPEKIIPLLTTIAGKGGSILLDTQLADRVNMSEVQKVYHQYVTPACNEKIKLLGLNPEKDTTRMTTTRQISVHFKVLKVNRSLRQKGLQPGDRIKVFQSLRPTEEALKKILQDLNHRVIDTGHSFVSVIIRT